MKWISLGIAIGFVLGVVLLDTFLSTSVVEAAEMQGVTATVTAYTSSVDETDDTPLVNAAGTEPHTGSIACPIRYPFGTVVRFEGNAYVCDDRMSSKYSDRFDIWVETKAEAFEFGIRNVIIYI